MAKIRINIANFPTFCMKNLDIQEIKAYSGYRHHPKQMSYWHTYDGKEIDVVLGDAEVGIEIKSTDEIKPRHLSDFKPFKEEFPSCRCIVVSRDFLTRQSGDIKLMYYQDFLTSLWKDEIIQ